MKTISRFHLRSVFVNAFEIIDILAFSLEERYRTVDNLSTLSTQAKKQLQTLTELQTKYDMEVRSKEELIKYLELYRTSTYFEIDVNAFLLDKSIYKEMYLEHYTTQVILKFGDLDFDTISNGTISIDLRDFESMYTDESSKGFDYVLLKDFEAKGHIDKISVILNKNCSDGNRISLKEPITLQRVGRIKSAVMGEEGRKVNYFPSASLTKNYRHIVDLGSSKEEQGYDGKGRTLWSVCKTINIISEKPKIIPTPTITTN